MCAACSISAPTRKKSAPASPPIRCCADRVAHRPGLRVPGAWDGFELGVRAILGQQVTVRGATTLAGRIVRAFGEPLESDGQPDGLTHLFPSPAALAAADYSAIGLPAARAETIRGLARAVQRGELSFSAVADPAAWIALFCGLPGIGPWTAQYVAMRGLASPMRFRQPTWACCTPPAHQRQQLEQRAEAWRPWRAYAAMHLWQQQKEKSDDQLHLHGKPRRSAAAGRG